MPPARSTRDKLLDAARALFWTRGFSNVSLREITKAAGVDVALVSRYFGSKQGLFEATLEEIPTWEALVAEPDHMLDAAVASFARPFDPKDEPCNPFVMLLANVIDPEMGDRIKTMVQSALVAPLATKIGGPHAEERAAMMLAALFGIALMRKSFQVAALADVPQAEVEAQLRHLATAALRFKAETSCDGAS